MRISRHPLTSFLMGLKTTKTRIVIHCDYIACASIVERMHPSFVQVVPFCLHEIRPASGNKYTDHWPNSPILEVCPKVVEHSLVKAKARKPPPPPHSPQCPSRVLNQNLLLQLMKQIPLQFLLPSALFEVVVLFSWFLQLPCCTNFVQLSFKNLKMCFVNNVCLWFLLYSAVKLTVQNDGSFREVLVNYVRKIVHCNIKRFSSVALAVNTNKTVVSTILVFTTKRRSKNFD